MRPNPGQPRISLFGNFGAGNFGNECTLQAMVCNIRRFMPAAEISCICILPADTAARYKISASVIKPTPNTGWAGRHVPASKWPRRIVIELYRWVKAIETMMHTDVLLMTGTGMLADFGIGPLGLHYDILRWSIAAKLCRRKLLFVSVGAGPIKRRLSRWFVKAALSLADYRSYRDSFSKGYLEGIGFKRTGDAVYPDLAFSLPSALVLNSQRDSKHVEERPPVIGIGLMTYFDRRGILKHGGTVYHGYVEKLASFVTWLFEHKYRVRLLIGDAMYDGRVIDDLRQLLKDRGLYERPEIIDEPLSSAEDVLSQLAATDYVVASRFHNILLALMLNKPVLSISYHEKVNGLMQRFGLQRYCQDIEHLDLDRLTGQLTELERNAAVLKAQIARTTEACRTALDAQYDRIFNLVIRARPSFGTSVTVNAALSS